MIIKEIVERVRHAKIDREKTLRRKKAGMLVLGVTIGSAVGALAGVLFAPKAGKEMRGDLSRRGSDAWEKIKENASLAGHQFVSAVEEQSSRVRTAAKGVLKETHKDNEEENKSSRVHTTVKGTLKEPAKENEGTDKKN